MSQGLDSVRKAAKERKQEQFTALLHHLSVDLLRDSFYALQRKASPGLDGDGRPYCDQNAQEWDETNLETRPGLQSSPENPPSAALLTLDSRMSTIIARLRVECLL